MKDQKKNLTIIVQQGDRSENHDCANCGAPISVITDGNQIPLLDRFAGDALKGLLARGTGPLTNGELELIVGRAYEVAESMMEARRDLAAEADITISEVSPD